LSLPGELRNEIYAHLLLNPSEGLHPAILSTCRQTHAEGTPLLYSHAFTAHPSLLTSLPHLEVNHHAYPPVLSPAALALIRRWRIKLRVDVDPRFSPSAACAAFSGAQDLEIDVRQNSYGLCPIEPVLSLFATVRGVNEVVIKGVGEEGMAFTSLLRTVMMAPAEQEKGGCEGWRCTRCRRCGCVELEEVR
jgi:hypothetical protein